MSLRHPTAAGIRAAAVVLMLGAAVSGSAQLALDVSPGTISRSFGTAEVDATAGNDFRRDLPDDVVTIAVTGTGGGSWTLSVKASTPSGTWPGSLHVALQGVSAGTGDGAATFTYESGYMQLTDSWQVFCTGTRDRTGIQVNARLSGLSVQVAPGTYAAHVLYEVQ